MILDFSSHANGATVTRLACFQLQPADRQGIGRNARFFRWDAERNYCCANRVLSMSGIPPLV